MNGHLFLNFSLVFFIGICTLILINLIIAFATKIYDEVDENIVPEHRANLIKIYEYLNWDEQYGIFKFLHAPLNWIQLPFSLLILSSENKQYWTDIYSKLLYFFIAFFYFCLLLILNLINIPFFYLYVLIIYPIKYGNVCKTVSIWLLFGPIYIFFYFILDILNFWIATYRRQQISTKGEKEIALSKILELKKLFTHLIIDISKRVENEKKKKKFNIIGLVSGWLLSVNDKKNKFSSLEDINRMHKRLMILKKYENNSNILNLNSSQRNSYLQVFKGSNNKNSYSQYFKNILFFLNKFVDEEGFIDKDVAINLFPKRNYYDEEFFEFLYYFNYNHFKKIIAKFTKNSNEMKREMNKMREVLIDLNKIQEKFSRLKQLLINISKKNLGVIHNGINTMNGIFALIETNLNNGENQELLNKIIISTSSQARDKQVTSQFQKQKTKI